MDKILRLFSTLDWLAGFLFLALGVYHQNLWFIASGVIAFIAAYFKPAIKIKAILEKKFVRKKHAVEDSAAAIAEDQFYSQVLAESEQESDVQESETLVRSYADPVSPYSGIYISTNKHNRLRREHLRLNTEPVFPVQYH